MIRHDGVPCARGFVFAVYGRHKIGKFLKFFATDLTVAHGNDLKNSYRKLMTLPIILDD